MSQDNPGFVRKWRNRAARALLRGVFRLSPPAVFMNTVNERIRAASMRDYMASRGGTDVLIEHLCGLIRDDAAVRAHMAKGGGMDRLLGNLYDIAMTDAALRDRIIRSEVGDVFRKLYPLALKDEGLGDYMTSRGVDDIFGYAREMAEKAGLPLAQRTIGYGQEGEDLILTRLFGDQADGFYVDVGAHHPFRFSNTYLLYLKGWRGINIDATPGSMTPFQTARPRDINLECMVSTDPSPHRYFQFEEPALNTISEELVRRRQIETPQYKLLGSVTLQPRTLASILEEHLPAGQSIDLMNVDVEGHDMDVLASNDWDHFAPRVLVVELLSTDYSDMEETEVYRFLAARGYRLLSKLFNSAVFHK